MPLTRFSHSPRFSSLFLRGIAPVILAGLIIGCSLSEYEKAMEYQQKRMEYLEEQNKVVAAEPIIWPDKDSSVNHLELYFRPLIGIDRTPQPTPLAGGLQRYKGGANYAFAEMLVAATKKDPLDLFRTNVLKALGMSNRQPVTKKVGEQTGRTLDFEFYQDSRPGSPYVYIYSDQGIHVAIALKPAPGKSTEQVEHHIDYSLASLVVGHAASKKFAGVKMVAPQAQPPAGKSKMGSPNI